MLEINEKSRKPQQRKSQQRKRQCQEEPNGNFIYLLLSLIFFYFGHATRHVGS